MIPADRLGMISLAKHCSLPGTSWCFLWRSTCQKESSMKRRPLGVECKSRILNIFTFSNFLLEKMIHISLFFFLFFFLF